MIGGRQLYRTTLYRLMSWKRLLQHLCASEVRHRLICTIRTPELTLLCPLAGISYTNIISAAQRIRGLISSPYSISTLPMSLAASRLYRINVHMAETVLSEIPKPFRSGYIQRTVVHLSS